MIAALFLLLPVLSWRYALRDTLHAALQIRELRTRVGPSTSADTATATPPAAAPEMLLSGELLGRLPDNVQVTGYAPALTERHGTPALHTAEVKMAGRFVDLLRAMHRIRCDMPECVVRSAAWELTTDRTTRSEQLTLTLYVEQLTDFTTE